MSPEAVEVNGNDGQLGRSVDQAFDAALKRLDMAGSREGAFGKDADEFSTFQIVEAWRSARTVSLGDCGLMGMACSNLKKGLATERSKYGFHIRKRIKRWVEDPIKIASAKET